MTFPIPGVAGATATATLDAKYMTERVVVTLSTLPTMVRELQGYPGSEQEIASTGPFGDLPILIISGDPDVWAMIGFPHRSSGRNGPLHATN